MPNFPLIDTHVHLWDLTRHEYPWLSGNPALCRPFGLEDYQYNCGQLQVEGIVFVEAGAAPACGLAEARWVSAMAAEEPRIKGIVASAQFERIGTARPHLEALRQTPLVKGVRASLLTVNGSRHRLRPGFVNAVRLLPDYGLSLDVCAGPAALPAVGELARRCPDIRIMLDHIANPDIRGRGMSPWRENITELARLPNVFCKVSGMATKADLEHWTREDLKPYFDHVAEAFGADRIAYGSDWPVCTLATRCPEWVEALDWAVRDWPARDVRKLFRDNAVKFYRLG